jgi:hypothetical protein
MPPLALFLLGVVVGRAPFCSGPSVAPEVRRNLRPTAAVVKTALRWLAVQVRTAELAEDIETFRQARADAAARSGDGEAAPDSA